MPRKKYDEEMDTVFRYRVNSTAKETLFKAVPSSLPGLYSATASDFWRDTSLEIAELLIQLKSGKLSRAEFIDAWRKIGEELATAAESGSRP